MGIFLGAGAAILINCYADWALGKDGRPSRITRWLVVGVVMLVIGLRLQQYCDIALRCVIALAMCAILVLIATIDLYQRRIPNILLVWGGLLAATNVWSNPDLSWYAAGAGGLVGLALFAAISLARRGALGAGDVKLACLIGAMTGFPAVLQALILGILAGGLVAAVLMITRTRTGKQYIPYAPYLVTGALATLLCGSTIAQWYASAFRLGG